MMRSNPISVRGITYPSQASCARALGLSPQTVYQALERGTMHHLGLGATAGDHFKRASVKTCRGWRLGVPVAADPHNKSTFLPDELRRQNAVNAILQASAAFYGFTVADLKGERRFKVLVRARDMAVRRLRDELGLSMPRIGQIMGGRDHTTILESLRRTEGK